MSSTTGPATTATAATLAGSKFLACRLSQEEYGIPILRVREIIGMTEITVLPRTPDHVLGVVNLRSRIIPVIDLRRKLGIEPAADTASTCIVVVDAGKDVDCTFRVGCVVDSVSEVLALGERDCEPAPRCAHGAGDCIAGLVTLGERVLILLDMERVVGEIDPSTAGEQP